MFLVPRNERPLEGRIGREETAHARPPVIFCCISPRVVVLDLNWVRELGRDYQQEAEAVACPELPSCGQRHGLLGLLDLDPLFSHEPYCYSPFGVP